MSIVDHHHSISELRITKAKNTYEIDWIKFL